MRLGSQTGYGGDRTRRHQHRFPEAGISLSKEAAAAPPPRETGAGVNHSARYRRVACFGIYYLIYFFCAYLYAGQSMAQSPVRVWEDSMMIPSSVEGLPDPNPPFDFFN